MTPTGYTVAKLASLIGAEVHGDPNCPVVGLASLTQASPGQISFLDNAHYRQYLATTKASAVILAAEDLSLCPTNALVTANPYLGYAKVAALFAPSVQVSAGVHASAMVAADCQIHPTASIGPFCVLGRGVVVGEGVIINAGCVIGEYTQIGAHSLLWANITIYHGVTIGERVIIHSGVVIGSDGFGIANDQGRWHKVPQLGKVKIGNDVEIGANTTIDRGALNDTVLEDGVKLDNQIQIGHNVHIGSHTAIAGCVGVAGSTKIGKYCLIGGGTGIGGHLEITDKVVITGMSRVTHSISVPGIYSSGSPIQTNREWRKNSVRLRQLDEMSRRLQRIEKMLQTTSETKL